LTKEKINDIHVLKVIKKKKLAKIKQAI